jgi:hypothetical protein
MRVGPGSPASRLCRWGAPRWRDRPFSRRRCEADTAGLVAESLGGDSKLGELFSAAWPGTRSTNGLGRSSAITGSPRRSVLQRDRHRVRGGLLSRRRRPQPVSSSWGAARCVNESTADTRSPASPRRARSPEIGCPGGSGVKSRDRADSPLSRVQTSGSCDAAPCRPTRRRVGPGAETNDSPQGPFGGSRRARPPEHQLPAVATSSSARTNVGVSSTLLCTTLASASEDHAAPTCSAPGGLVVATG